MEDYKALLNFLIRWTDPHMTVQNPSRSVSERPQEDAKSSLKKNVKESTVSAIEKLIKNIGFLEFQAIMELSNVVVRTLEEDNQSIPCTDEENAPTDISNVFLMKHSFLLPESCLHYLGWVVLSDLSSRNWTLLMT